MSQAIDAPSAVAKWSKRWFQLSGFLFIACVIMAVALFAVSRANKANSNIQASCQQEYDFATVPLTAQTSKAVLNIVADSHIYYLKVCDNRAGTLPKPDPRVAQIVAIKQHR